MPIEQAIVNLKIKSLLSFADEVIE